MLAKPELLLDGLTFPESPRWRDDRLWFSDMDEGRVKAVSLDGKLETVAELPGMVSGLGWAPDGALLVVAAAARKIVRFDGARSRDHADLSPIARMGANDMVVSEAGHAYVDTLLHDFLRGEALRPSPLAWVRPDGSVALGAEDLLFPNGMAITPDGSTLVCGETFGARYSAFDIRGDGSLARRRVWAEVPGEHPDGCCLDAEGAIWFASPPRGVVRVLEGGRVTQRTSMPATAAYACMLGGPERRTLFVCCSETHDRAVIRKRPSGRIYAFDVDVPGAGLP
jgi:sugar lactone lactonase YvrE